MSREPIVQPSRNGQQTTDVIKTPDPEVVPKAERWRFSAEYKLRILAEADACTQRDEIGALLRREGLSNRGRRGPLVPALHRGPFCRAAGCHWPPCLTQITLRLLR